MQPCTVQKVQFPWTVTMYFSIHITVTLEILSAPSCMCIFFSDFFAGLIVKECQ